MVFHDGRPVDRARRQVHLRRDHGPPQPVPAGLGLRAGEDRPGDRSAHRAGRLQTPLLPGRGDLGDRPPARAPAGRGGPAPGGRARRTPTPPSSACARARSTAARSAAGRSCSASGSPISTSSSSALRATGRGPPTTASYVYRIVPDLLTQEIEFYAGTIDAYAVQPHQVARLQADPALPELFRDLLGYSYIAYNLRRPPFDDLRVRRALGLAINVDDIIRYVLYDQGERTTGPFPQQTEYYDRTIAPLPYDPAGAALLLAEAGWQRNGEGMLEKDGQRLRFTLITNSGNDSAQVDPRDRAGRLAAARRRRVARIESSGRCSSRSASTSSTSTRSCSGWSMGLDPDLYQIWHSSQSGPYQLNFIGYRNPEADELIVRIRQEYDFRRQVELCRRLHAIIAHDQPYTFLYVGKWTALLDRRIVMRDPDGAYRRISRPGRAATCSTSTAGSSWRRCRTLRNSDDGISVFRSLALWQNTQIPEHPNTELDSPDAAPSSGAAPSRRSVTLFCVSVVSFAIVHLAPGEPSQVDPMNPKFTPEMVARFRQTVRSGPAPARPVRPLLRGLLTGRHRAWKDNQPVLAEVSGAVPEQPAPLRRGDPPHLVGSPSPWASARPSTAAALTTAPPRSSSYVLISIPGFFFAYIADHLRGADVPGAGDRHPDLRHARGPPRSTTSWTGSGTCCCPRCWGRPAGSPCSRATCAARCSRSRARTTCAPPAPRGSRGSWSTTSTRCATRCCRS